MRRYLVRAAVIALGLILVLGTVAGFWARAQLRASLPQLDGTLQVAGLSAPVSIVRDSLGIPTVRGASRVDVARAIGVLHAQERFFAMDLARRRAAGELAALVGARALAADREIRLHRFRAGAERAVANMTPDARRVLDAYAAGVNTGLTSLGAAPFEYLILRQNPRPWLPEDSLLVVLSMFITLQDYTGSYESTLATMSDLMPKPMVDLLVPDGTEWDSPVVGTAFSVPPIPGPDVYDLRARRSGKKERIVLPPPRQETSLPPGLGVTPWDLGFDSDRGESAVGSNNWVIAGRLTADGAPLVANDMHLTVRVPNTWYRAALEWPDPSSPSGPLRLIGITLPGVPALVVGSNTHIAWGFTNTYADWTDLVLLEVDPQDLSRYRTPEGWRAFDRHDEVIEVAGAPPEHLPVSWTIWGPVVTPDHHGRARALRWVAHDVERLAVASAALETAHTVDEAFDAVNGIGAPGQNFVAADTEGHIGWTVYGSIPKRVGFDGRLPHSWADGARGWNGYLSPAEYPRLRDPESGRLWTANARVVDGEMLAKLGDGSYEVGSRARIIRDRLMAKDQFTPADLLDIQLETSATFLARWRDLILRTLTPAAIAGNGARAHFRDVVERTWDGQASAGSAGYRLTRHVSRGGLQRRDRIRAGRVLRGGRLVRLPHGPSSRRADLEARHRTADAPARSRVRDMGRAARRGRRSRHRTGRRCERPGRAVVAIEHHRLSPSAVVGDPVLRKPARHAGAATQRRPLHAAHALGRQCGVRAHDRLTRPRGQRHHAHADRPERPPAVALLRQLTRGLGERRGDAVSAGGDRTHTDADAVTKRLKLTLTRMSARSKTELYVQSVRVRVSVAQAKSRAVKM